MQGEIEAVEAPGTPGRQALSPEAQRLFDEGRAALDSNRVSEALESLRQASAEAPDHAQIRSFLGLAVARSDRAFSEARTLCEEAASQEFFNPELYLNLAKVYLHFGRRSEALRYLRRGQMIDPGHDGIQKSISSLGKRGLPIVPFLPRRHPVNRALGAARSRVVGVFSRV